MADNPYDELDEKRGKAKLTAHVRWRPSYANEDHDYWFFIRHAEIEFRSSGRVAPNGPLMVRPGHLPPPPPQEFSLTVVGLGEAEETEQLSLTIGQCEGWRMEALMYAVEAFQQGHAEHAMEVGHLALTAARDGDASKQAQARLTALQHLGRAPHPSDTTG